MKIQMPLKTDLKYTFVLLTTDELPLSKALNHT